MVIETFPVGPLGCNCSIVFDEVSGDAIVVDPGGEFEKIRARLEKLGARPTAIVHTHTHIDHVGATAPLQRWSSAGAHIHEADRPLYDILHVQAEMLRLAMPERCDLEGDLEDGMVFRAGEVELAVLHTPGHTPGSVTFFLEHGGERVAFTGDTLFRGSIGRTDLWLGDAQLILRSLRERLLVLPPETRVVAGHGPFTTIGEEQRHNPYLRSTP